MTVRVLIADDQHLVRTGLQVILNSEPDIEVIGQATTGLEAVTFAHEMHPDVVLMDIRMPELDGIEATRQITTDNNRGIHVLVLTTFDVDEYVFEALRAGASGFLLKDVPAAQLVTGVRMTAAGDALLAPSITRRLIEHSRPPHPPSRQPSTISPHANLRSSAFSPKACPTLRSPPSCSLATRPSRPTSHDS